MIFLMYLVLGACAGLLAGLFGVGGGLIIVPALIFSFKAQGMDPEVLTHIAIGTSLATIIITSVSSINSHHNQGAVRWSIFSTLGPGILLGTFFGATTAVNLSSHILQNLLGLFAVAISLKMWFGFKVYEGARVPGKTALVIAGVVIGSISSMLGIGGGTFTVPFLRKANLTMKQAIGTSAACGLPIALMGTAFYIMLGQPNKNLPQLTTGYIYWPAFFGIVLTSMLFARYGASIAHVLKPEKLQKIFAIFLMVVGASLIWFQHDVTLQLDDSISNGF